MKIIYAIVGVILLYYLYRYLFQKCWSRKLKVEITLSKDHAFEGEDLVLTETVWNHKLLPLPILKVKFMTSRHLVFQDMSNSKISDNYYRNDLISVLMYQKLTRSIPFRCSNRGYFTIDKIYLVSSDLLLSKEYVSESDIHVHLYVYPRPVDARQLEIPFQKMLGTVLTKRFMNEDPFEFKSIREYQTYDTLKTINWKASAKAGSLMVNVFDYTSSQQIHIFINLEPAVLRIQGAFLEESIRVAATLAVKFIEQGVPTSIYTNALDIITKKPVSIPAGSGVNHIRSINEALARIDTGSDILGFLPKFKKEMHDFTHNDYIVLISSYQREDLQQLLSTMLQDKIDFMWVIPNNSEMTNHIAPELMPYTVEWELKEE